jgi:hypothetical protein
MSRADELNTPRPYIPGPRTCPRCGDDHPFDRPCSPRRELPAVDPLELAYRRLFRAIAARLS